MQPLPLPHRAISSGSVECDRTFAREHGCFEREGGPEKQTSVPPEEGEAGVKYHIWQWPGNRKDATEECAPPPLGALFCSFPPARSCCSAAPLCRPPWLSGRPSIRLFMQGGHDPRQAEDLTAVQVPQQVQLVRVLRGME